MQRLHNGALAHLEPGSKILFACVPGDGHFNPLTGLAKHLQQQGCDVRWYTSPYYQSKVEKLGIPFLPLRKALDITGENIELLLPERNAIRNPIKKLSYDLINFFILRSTEYFSDIVDIKKDFDFALMIADSAFSAIPLVKEKLNVPVIGISVFPLSEQSKDLPPYGLGLLPSTSAIGKLKQSVLRWLADKVLFAKPNKVMRHVMEQNGIEPGKSNMFDLLVKKSTLLLQSGTPGFEYKRSDLGSNIRFIGPLLPYSEKQKSSWSSEKLKQYRKVILVTQGTVEKGVEKIIVPTLEAFKDSDYLVIATTGGSGTEELKPKYPQSNLIIEDYIPFDAVMPYTDVYVTNGGYGGVMLGIENKVPLVVSGVHEGKNEICARVGYFKLGIDLKKDRPSPLQIKWAVEEILNDPQYKTNTERLAREFADYDPKALTASYVAGLLQKNSYLTNSMVVPRKTVEYEVY